MRTRVKDILELTELPQEKLTIKGWVRTVREYRKIAFIDVSDGSSVRPLQVVVTGMDLTGITTGTSVSVYGEVVESQGAGQKWEFVAEKLEEIGKSVDYPIQPKRHSMEFLREHSHLRMRTDLFGCIFRIRSKVAYAVHKFFQEKGYTHAHTPIITGSDCEGAGETFGLTPEDFFGKEVALTVSGQLHGETAMMGLGQIYTFGPTFRAEQSFTSRHLSEFWMIEPEIAFADLEEIAELSEEFLKYLISYVLTECPEEVKFLRDWKIQEEKGLKKELQSEILDEKLERILASEFVKVTYTEAIDLLMKSKPYKKGKFEYPVSWGEDLKAEHEKYLVEKIFKSPVIITDYPKDIKAFYMKMGEDGKTVRAMDVLFPEIGEIIGGSQREEDMDVLVSRMSDIGLGEEEMAWYLDTRRFGTIPHAGFGLGFERLIQFVTGMDSIKDVTMFPRSAKSCKF